MAVVPTPLKANEDADLEGIERLINFLAGHGLALFALGSAGEGMNLTFATRVVVARKMAEVNNGRVPLLVGGGSFSVRGSLEFIDAVADCCIDGIHIIPYDKKISGEAVQLLYRGIADQSPLPIWLYQNTTRTSGIPIEVVKFLEKPPEHSRRQAGGVRSARQPRFHGAQLARFPGLRLGRFADVFVSVPWAEKRVPAVPRHVSLNCLRCFMQRSSPTA